MVENDNKKKLDQEIQQLQYCIVKLRTELENTKDLVKKHNEFREDIINLSERLKAVEVQDEQEEKHKKFKIKETAIRQIGLSFIYPLLQS